MQIFEKQYTAEDEGSAVYASYKYACRFRGQLRIVADSD